MLPKVKIYTYFEEATGGERVAQQFLTKLHSEVAKSMTVYHSRHFNNYLMPYDANERAMDAVVLPALSRLCGGMVMTELRVNRKEKQVVDGHSETCNYTGRADYWCIYKDYSFIIELKHKKETIQLDKCYKTTQATWCTMIKQLQAIADEVRAYEEHTKGIIRIGIQFAPLQLRERSENLLDDFYKHPKKKFETIQTKIKTKECKTLPNYQSMWVIPENIAKDEQEKQGLLHRNVALLLIARIYPVIEHCGCVKIKNKICPKHD